MLSNNANATMQDGESDALVKLRRGVNIYDGSADHDGRLWHRVQQSPHTGAYSFRRTMYIPFLTDQYHPKDINSKTPIYHKIGVAMRKFKQSRSNA